MSAPEARAARAPSGVIPIQKHDANPRRGIVRWMRPEGIAALMDLLDRVEARLAAETKDV